MAGGLVANGVYCLECPGFSNYHLGAAECPADPEHPVDPVFITTKPLGRDDDADNLVHGHGFYAYDAVEEHQ